MLTSTFTKKETFTVKSQIANGIAAETLHGLWRNPEPGTNVSAFWTTVNAPHALTAFVISIGFIGALIAGALP